MIVEEGLNRLGNCWHNKIGVSEIIYGNATRKLGYFDGARPALPSSRSCWVRYWRLWEERARLTTAARGNTQKEEAKEVLRLFRCDRSDHSHTVTLKLRD